MWVSPPAKSIGTAPANTRESARGSGAYFFGGDARQSKAFARFQCMVATPHGLVLVLALITRRCAHVCVPAAVAGGGARR